jgi:hypothetical protein
MFWSLGIIIVGLVIVGSELEKISRTLREIRDHVNDHLNDDLKLLSSYAETNAWRDELKRPTKSALPSLPSSCIIRPAYSLG